MHNWHPPAQVLNCVELLIILYEFFFEKQIGYGVMLNRGFASTDPRIPALNTNFSICGDDVGTDLDFTAGFAYN